MADKKDTAEYSATKAPETRKQAEEKTTVKDWRLQPGGEKGSPTRQGMAALDREALPSGAKDSGETSYGDTGRPETK
jgi:hypothetical protein